MKEKTLVLVLSLIMVMYILVINVVEGLALINKKKEVC